MNYVLFAISLVTPFAVALLAALFVALILVTSYSSLCVGLVVIAATFALDVMSMSQPILRLGITLYVADLPMVLLCAVAVARWCLRPDVPRRDWAWLILALIFFGNLLLGLAKHGSTAGVQARPDFYAFAAAVYALTFPIGRKEVRQMLGVFAGLAVVLMLLCVYRWTVYYGNIRDLLPLSGTYNIDGAIRVVGSSSALLIGQTLIIGLFFGPLGRGATAARSLLLLTAAAVLVLQHRSVWLAVIIGVGAGFIIVRSQKTSRLQQLLMLSGLLAVGAIGLASSSALRGEVQSSAVRAIEGQDTVAGRFSNWKATLTQWREAGPRAIVMGREAGADSRRVVENSDGSKLRISYGAHNHYIIELTTQGVLGLSLYLWILVRLLWRLYQQSREDDADAPYASLLLVLMLMQCTYHVAYATDMIQFLIFGIACAFAFRRHAESADPAPAMLGQARMGPVVL